MKKSLFLLAVSCIAITGCDSVDTATGLPKHLAANAPANIREPLVEGKKILDELKKKQEICEAGAKFIQDQIEEARKRGRSHAIAAQQQDLQMLRDRQAKLREEWNSLKDAMGLLQSRYVASTTSGKDSQVQETLGDVHRRIQVSRESLKRAQTGTGAVVPVASSTPSFQVGDRVVCQQGQGGLWWQAEVLAVNSDGRVRVHYTGYGNWADEEVTAERIRPNAVGLPSEKVMQALGSQR